MAESGNSFLNWLGRQIGHVARAVKTDVQKKQVVHRETRVQEAPVADQPGVVLRRTTIDEVIVKEDKETRFEANSHG
jgi:hypothetical protein